MKNCFLNHCKRYKICYIMATIIILGLHLSAFFPKICKLGDSILSFDFNDMYLLFIIPILSIVYGIVSHIKSNKIVLPQLIYLIILVFGYLLLSFLLNGNFEKTGGILILCTYPIGFSIGSTLITAFILKIIKAIKQSNS